MKVTPWLFGLGVGTLMFVALVPLVSAPECKSYSSDVTGCEALARSVLQIRVYDGAFGIAIALLVAGAAGLLVFAMARRARTRGLRSK